MMYEEDDEGMEKNRVTHELHDKWKLNNKGHLLFSDYLEAEEVEEEEEYECF